MCGKIVVFWNRFHRLQTCISSQLSGAPPDTTLISKFNRCIQLIREKALTHCGAPADECFRLMLIAMKGILLWVFHSCRFICIYSASGSDTALKSSSVELIRAVLAYPSDYCGGYGSLPTGTHYFSHSKHLIFPRYHCWYSCNGSNSKVLTVIFTIPCKQLVRHLAQWHPGSKNKWKVWLDCSHYHTWYFNSCLRFINGEHNVYLGQQKQRTNINARFVRSNALFKKP